MNGNTYFNLRFYNPLPVQFAAADSEAHVTMGVTRRDSEPHIFRILLGDFHSPILRTWGRLQENTYVSASPLADLNIRGSALTGCKKKLALEVHLTCT